jgi:hypothetical protein
MFSLDAVRWCAHLGIRVLVLGSDSTTQLASTPRMTDDARLRRTQALAPFEAYGLDVARWLMCRKIQGQGMLVLRHFGDSMTAETAISPSPPRESKRSMSCASSKRVLPPFTSGPGLAAQSVPRDLQPRTATDPASLVTLRRSPLSARLSRLEP